MCLSLVSQKKQSPINCNGLSGPKWPISLMQLIWSETAAHFWKHRLPFGLILSVHSPICANHPMLAQNPCCSLTALTFQCTCCRFRVSYSVVTFFFPQSWNPFVELPVSLWTCFSLFLCSSQSSGAELVPLLLWMYELKGLFKMCLHPLHDLYFVQYESVLFYKKNKVWQMIVTDDPFYFLKHSGSNWFQCFLESHLEDKLFGLLTVPAPLECWLSPPCEAAACRTNTWLRPGQTGFGKRVWDLVTKEFVWWLLALYSFSV